MKNNVTLILSVNLASPCCCLVAKSCPNLWQPHGLSSFDKETACNAGDLGLIPGSGRSPGEGNGNPLQYSCLENPMDRGAWQSTVHGVTRVGHNLAIKPSPWTVAHQAPLSMGFPRQEYWSGLPFPSPGDIPHPRMELADSLQKTLMLGMTEGKRRRGRQRMRWLHGITDSMDMNLSNSILGMEQWMQQ